MSLDVSSWVQGILIQISELLEGKVAPSSSLTFPAPPGPCAHSLWEEHSLRGEHLQDESEPKPIKKQQTFFERRKDKMGFAPDDKKKPGNILIKFI